MCARYFDLTNPKVKGEAPNPPGGEGPSGAGKRVGRPARPEPTAGVRRVRGRVEPPLHGSRLGKPVTFLRQQEKIIP